ncbi:MAG TPA: M1 family metallopeptidase, partial [Candidatus Eisenbacteria bacterium]|nr:M1 family metallopeptidase [Candidatus Eisenbacteria bacterium]
MTQTQRHRLPLSVSPQRYEIRLEPDLNAARFSGEEKVVLEVHEPVDRLTLNAAELEISGVRLTSATGNALAGDVRLDAENEQAILRLPETVAPGMYELQLAFSGILNDKLHGFYRSTYKSPAGEQKTLASTQFESTDARRAFPCWDEPAFKAVFQVTLVIDEHLTAISNARIMRESSLPGTGKKTIMFADTIKMSTYLVAFIVGEFEGTEPTMVGNTPLRVWAVPGKNRLGRFGQEAGAFSLRFFSDYYGIPYPGDKLDLVAIPDFASGAMENLGAITFRETALLVDEEKATRSELERVADVVSHENAHMWFGDLVTMRWWNGLWLNEAFATFMEMLAVDAWKPQWRRWDSFTVSRAAAMQVDGLKSTRAIEFPVERPEEAAGMFDVLTYEKGASVLRMLEQYLGAERFRDGIRLYLRRHAYANAETTDLWDAIEEATREPVRAMMDTWIFQPGLPLIRVERVGREIRLSQQLFRYLEPSEPVTERRWHVPVLLRFHTEREASERWVLLTDRELRLEAPESLESVVVNAGGHGFYRVWYSPDLLRALTQRLQSTLKPVERFNWVNDTWAVTLAGLGSLPDYLEVIDMMRDETDVNVWTSVIASCHQLYRILDDAQWRLFQTRVRGALSPAVERLGWSPRDGEPELE